MKWLIPFTKVNISNMERQETETVSASMSGIFLNCIYTYIYLKCACLNLYWVHIGPETTGLCSSLSLLVTQNTVSDSVTETLLKCWLINNIISASFLMLLLMCTTHLFFDSLTLLAGVCLSVWIFLAGMWEREWVGRKRAHFLIILVCNSCVCSCVLSVMIDF